MLIKYRFLASNKQQHLPLVGWQITVKILQRLLLEMKYCLNLSIHCLIKM
jgi:hypothetical protein